MVAVKYIPTGGNNDSGFNQKDKSYDLSFSKTSVPSTPHKRWKRFNRSRHRRRYPLVFKPKFFRPWQKKANKKLIRAVRRKRYKIIRTYLKPFCSFSLEKFLKGKGKLYSMKFRKYYKVFGKYYGKSHRMPRISLFFGFQQHDYWKQRYRQKKRIYFFYKGVPNPLFGVRYKANVFIKEYPVFRWRVHDRLSPYLAYGYRFKLKRLLRKYNSTLNTFRKSKKKRVSAFKFNSKRTLTIVANRKTFKFSTGKYTFYPRTSKKHFRLSKSFATIRYLQYCYYRRHRKFAKMRSFDRELYFIKRFESGQRSIIRNYFFKKIKRPLSDFKIRKLFYRAFIEPKRVYKRFNKKIKSISKRAARNIFKRRSRFPFSSRKVFKRTVKYKRLNSFPIKLRAKKIIRKRIWHKKQVKLDRAFRIMYNKPHHRKKTSVDNRWDFLLEKAFSNYYNLRYSLFTMFYSRSVAEVNQQINYGRFSINGHSPKNETYLFKGDLVCDLYKNNDFDLESNIEDIKTRRMFYSFIELDDYIQNIAVVKDVDSLSSSDTFLMNMATTRFANVNFLRR